MSVGDDVGGDEDKEGDGEQGEDVADDDDDDDDEEEDGDDGGGGGLRGCVGARVLDNVQCLVQRIQLSSELAKQRVKHAEVEEQSTEMGR